jgi:hypothetical protein
MKIHLIFKNWFSLDDWLIIRFYDYLIKDVRLYSLLSINSFLILDAELSFRETSGKYINQETRNSNVGSKIKRLSWKPNDGSSQWMGRLIK